MSVNIDRSMERFVCAVGFRDNTWGTYSQNATTDNEAQGLPVNFDDESRIATGGTKILPQ